MLVDLLLAEEIAPEIRKARHRNLVCCECARHGDRYAAPLRGLDVQLTAARFGEPIVVCTALVFGFAPFGREPTGFFHAVERGKQRSRFDIEGAGGDLANAVRYAEAVQGI